MNLLVRKQKCTKNEHKLKGAIYRLNNNVIKYFMFPGTNYILHL